MSIEIKEIRGCMKKLKDTDIKWKCSKIMLEQTSKKNFKIL